MNPVYKEEYRCFFVLYFYLVRIEIFTIFWDFNTQGVCRLSEDLKLKLMVSNLFDKEYTYPEYERGNIGDLGNGPERAFYGKVEYLF